MPALRRVAGGLVTGGFTDHHVHLQLVDATLLADSTLARVVDLGGDPTAVARTDVPGIDVRFAGAFLTPPGGYPSDRDWAPAGAVREIPDAAAATRAIAELAGLGASCIKVASNSTAGPVFPDPVLRRIVHLARARRLPVVVHAEGAGEARRAVRAGAAALAHAPFTQRLTDAEIAEHAASVRWVSTLAIHNGAAYRTAVDNVRRFHAAGGAVRYGTDMGNGPTPVSLNPREVAALREAGLDGAALLAALAPVPPERAPGRLVLLPGDDPDAADPLTARPLSPEELEELA